MRVLVTGGAGYLGSVLVPILLEQGDEVTVLDRFFFGADTLPENGGAGHLTRAKADIRWCDGSLLEKQDAVVDLAALSNDPAGALDAWKTYEINFLGRSRIARLAKKAGVPRYLMSSSCSIYGFQDGILDETSKVNPLTAYAEANVLIEKDNLPLHGPDFCATALRFATLYGLSKRMRFDLAINGMVLGATKTGKIPVMRDGTQWRPFLHVHDAALAISEVLRAPTGRVNGQAYNVGSDDQNFQIRPLADAVATSMRSPPQVDWYGSADVRSYRVSFAKFHAALGFEPKMRPADAVREIEGALADGSLAAGPTTNTVEWYKHLLTDPQAAAPVALHGVVL
jgi:nucleoside-diphosphate-sugar epimerase